MLRRLWPHAKQALEFCWIPGGWDADKDGVMEGCQHNTMDVEYFGPNPQMGAWYLGALRAVRGDGPLLGEDDFAGDVPMTCSRAGSRWMDANLFNGEYYEHQIVPPKDAAAIAPGLRVGMGADDLADPELQLGAGCLVDQLVGQYMAHVCGLGYLLEPGHVGATMQSIMRYNFKTEHARPLQPPADVRPRRRGGPADGDLSQGPPPPPPVPVLQRGDDRLRVRRRRWGCCTRARRRRG